MHLPKWLYSLNFIHKQKKVSNLEKCRNWPIKECPTVLIYLIEFHLSKEKRAVTSLAEKLHKGSCQLRVKPLCYKKNETNRKKFLMLMMNNERVVQLMTNLDSHGKVIKLQCLFAIAFKMVERRKKSHINYSFQTSESIFSHRKMFTLSAFVFIFSFDVALRNSNNRSSSCKVLQLAGN